MYQKFSLLSNVSYRTQAGDALPNVDLFEGAPDKKVNLAEECKTGKHIVFGVPGAFTPGCSITHLPGYVSKADELKSKGVQNIFCISVNDPFVLDAWEKSQNATGKVRILADPCGDLTKAMDLQLDNDHLAEVLGPVRCRRFSMLVEDGKVTKINIEPDGTGVTCSLPKHLLQKRECKICSNA